MKFISIGNGNMVAAHRVISVVGPDSAPIDVSCGRRTRSVIFTDSDHIILSAIKPETISTRLNGQAEQEDEEESDDEG